MAKNGRNECNLLTHLAVRNGKKEVKLRKARRSRGEGSALLQACARAEQSRCEKLELHGQGATHKIILWKRIGFT